jgi:hypothetical protein
VKARPTKFPKRSQAALREFIHSLRGSCKFDTGGKSFAEWMADWKREEIELEEKKFQRFWGGKKQS